MSRADEAFTFHPGESFNGAVARWAADAWVERMMDVTRVAGVTFGHRQNAASADEGSIRALADEMRVDADQLLARATPYVPDDHGRPNRVRFRGITLPATLLERRRRLHAPQALRTSPHHRAIWDVRLLPADPTTGELLLDRCQNPICEGKALGWQQTSGIERCEHCMADLRDSRTDRLPDDLRLALRPVADLFDADTRPGSLALLPARLAALGDQGVVDLLVRLIRVADPGLAKLLRAPHGAEPLQLCQALAAAWRMMTGWPHSFHEHAIRRINERVGSHGDGNRRETVRFLVSRPNAMNSEAVAEVAMELRRSIDLSGPNGPAIARAAHSVKEAARTIGRSTAIVARHRREGVLRSILALDGVGNLQPLLSRAEIEIIAVDIRRRIGLDAVRSKLGIALHGAEQLAEMRLIDIIPHPYFLAQYGIAQATRPSYDLLLDRLDLAARPPCPEATVRLSAAMCVVGGRLKPWGPVFQAIVHRAIPCRIEPGPKPLSHRLHVRRQDVAFLGSLGFTAPTSPIVVPSPSLSKQDAFETLNILPREGTRLFANVPTLAGTHDRTLRIDDVLDLALIHISALELGRRRGLSASTAYNDAIRAGVPKLGLAGFDRTIAEAEFFGGALP